MEHRVDFVEPLTFGDYISELDFLLLSEGQNIFKSFKISSMISPCVLKVQISSNNSNI